MKQLSINVDDAVFISAEQQAKKKGTSLSSLLLEYLTRFAANTDDFDRLEQEEQALRARMKQHGRNFTAADRVGRDELHSRHALH